MIESTTALFFLIILLLLHASHNKKPSNLNVTDVSPEVMAKFRESVTNFTKNVEALQKERKEDESLNSL